MNANDFVDILKKSDTISGDFDFRDDAADVLMDLDLSNKRFIAFKAVGGDFASGIFSKCVFNKVIFNGTSFVGVNFDDCRFVDCKFSNVSSDFNMRNCVVEKFTTTQEN